ncbi:MAG: triphosphoribosyl-dephospho-CoA synthase [Methylococcales bacterium]|nr:triphosphoribosyl-dephospho-CoA synthase [Methylococcales bacterium]MDD5754674.1 triphosphoribosyl-dephospho-CoA synthase [Methylococcales bacterium]
MNDSIFNKNKLADLYRNACEVELQAFKPGNVSIYSEGHDMTVDDFRRSAEVSALSLCEANYSLGEKIFYAVKATRDAVGCNTNLGIILLCAPLIHAVQNYPNLGLRAALSKVLNNTTIDDANWSFKAITLASPGGLGEVNKQDVNQNSTVTLQAAMRLSSTKDRIALQYVSDYKDIFDLGVFSYTCAFNRWGEQSWAAVAVYASLLSQFPDSHIERKFGSRYSARVATMMRELSDELRIVNDPEQVKPLLYQMDAELKSHGLNPGTSADLTVATVLTAFLECSLCK